jgi:hypothetical protein
MEKRVTFLMFSLVLLVTFASGHATTKTPAYIMTPEEIELLKAQPLSLLAKFPYDSSAMARYVASAVVEDPSVVGALLSTASATSPEQAAALGAGLARGARAVGMKHPKIARAIKRQVLQSENLQLKVTFLALGPSYEIGLTSELPGPLPPAPIAEDKKIGGELPPDQSRLGPFGYSDNTYKDKNQGDDIPALDAGGERIADYMVFNEIINDDAPKNGAVSTSPTQ